MELSDVRKIINNIDDSMKGMFDSRIKCSEDVATVKMQNNDEVYKPVREQEICTRFKAEPEYVCLIKKVMQISRKHQYEMFIESKKADQAYINEICEKIEKSKANDGVITLKYTADATGENGLTINEILSLAGDTTLEIKGVNFEKDIVEINVKVDEDKIKEACVLSYMLYKETQ